MSGKLILNFWSLQYCTHSWVEPPLRPQLGNRKVVHYQIIQSENELSKTYSIRFPFFEYSKIRHCIVIWQIHPRVNRSLKVQVIVGSWSVSPYVDINSSLKLVRTDAIGDFSHGEGIESPPTENSRNKDYDRSPHWMSGWYIYRWTLQLQHYDYIRNAK
jgi:hypothetical protein